MPERVSGAGGEPWATAFLDDLAAHGLEVAPHVAARLVAALHADVRAVREVAAALTSAQRRGFRALPDPLPYVSAIEEAFAAVMLDTSERELLLAASLCLDDQVDVLLDLAGADGAALMSGGVSTHLVLGAGRFAFIDGRMRIWLHESASAAERTHAHARLSELYLARQDALRAAWHQARGSIARCAEAAPVLIAAARELSESGQASSAYRLAAEAAEHADDEMRHKAFLVAGAAALGAGCMEDAVDWLGRIRASPGSAHRGQALACLLIAETYLSGSVPKPRPQEYRPRSDDGEQWHYWARAASLAAGLCAERGARSATRTWLGFAREADARAGAGGAICEPAAALCGLLAGESRLSSEHGHGPLSGSIHDALRAALDGDIERGLRILADEEGFLNDETDPLIPGFERTPLLGAYRAVLEALLRFWNGEVAAARDRLIAASAIYPIALPFAGLGVALSRRLDLAVRGSEGVVSRSLTTALPVGTRVDRLVDRGISAYLRGAAADAARQIELWIDRGAPRSVLGMPGLDEVGPAERTWSVEPPELVLARSLRGRIRRAPHRAWQQDYPEILEQSRLLRGAFTRARVEALLGSTCAIRGDRTAGRRHLLAARSLFIDAGAHAWRASVDQRLARLGELDEGEERSDPAVSVSTDPLAACRAAWTPLLTDRELEISMLVAEGATNREISQRLLISVRTVEVHLGRIFSKLDVRTRVELTVLAHRTDHHL